MGMRGVGAETTESERRLVSVLFCDLVGSTVLASDLDAEDFRDLMRAYQQVVTDIINEHGGVVARYVGDGVLAYFGHPVGHENDAEMAVRTGQRIAPAVRGLRGKGYRTLDVRIGIATGTILIGDLMGTKPLEKGAAAGEAPYRAARLQSLAEPGSVVVCDATKRLAGNFFSYFDLGQVELKGFARPIAAWAVRSEDPGVDSRFDALRGGFGLTPISGRTAELVQLRAAADAAHSGHGRVLLVRGEAGIGKSRLVRALIESCGNGTTVVQFACEPQSENSSLAPLISFLNRASGIQRSDSAAEKLDKLKAFLADQHADPSDVRYFAPLLSIIEPDAIPGFDATPEQRKERTLKASEELLLGIAGTGSSILVFEDLHWVDPTTLILLQRLESEAAKRSVPILILGTTRPDEGRQWTASPNTSVIELGRLNEAETLAIVTAISGADSLPKDTVDRILLGSEGVPLFAEELARNFIEAGLSQARKSSRRPRLPDSLQATLTARLDRLPTALRVAEIGAAIGRSFPVDIVEALSPIKGDALRAALDELVSARLIEPVPDSAGAAFAFKHALVRDAAYSKLDGEALPPLHENIGTALETMRPELVETEPQTLAFHFARAAAPSRAMPYLQKAGLRAASRAAHIEAANHYRMALDLLGAAPDRAQRLTEELGLQLQFALSESASIGYGAETVETAYGRARELCSLLGNPSELYVVLRGLCTFYIVRDKLSVARQLAEECIAIGRRTGRPEQLIEGYNGLGYVLVHAGDLRGGREALEEVLRLYADTHQRGVIYGTEQDPAVAAGSLLSHATWLMGDREAGLRRRDDAIAHALTLNHPFTVAYAHTYAAMFGNIRLDFNDAAYHGRIAAAISQEHGFNVWLATSSMQLALAEGALGKVKDAIKTVSKILAAYEAGGAELTVSYYCAGLCHNLRADGQLTAALAMAERGISQARRTGEHFYLSVLLRQRGELLVALGQGALADAIEEIRSAVTLARRQGATELAARAVEALDRISAKLGKGIDPTSAMAASEASPAAVDL